MRVRIKLDFTIEGDWRAIPDGLPDRIGTFIVGGLENVGVIGNGKECELLGGSRMSASIVRENKGGVPTSPRRKP
jgi:hypothetical protein